jgi:hypothetical protein
MPSIALFQNAVAEGISVAWSPPPNSRLPK